MQDCPDLPDFFERLSAGSDVGTRSGGPSAAFAGQISIARRIAELPLVNGGFRDGSSRIHRLRCGRHRRDASPRARTAARGSPDRIPPQHACRAVRASGHRVPRGLARGRVRRRRERDDRVSLGRQSPGSIAGPRGGSGASPGGGDRRQQPCGRSGEGRHRDHTGRLRDGRRPGAARPRRQPQPAGWQYHGDNVLRRRLASGGDRSWS